MTRRSRVLLLGDSIRLGYQPIVVKFLKEVAEVVGPGNCQYSLHTLASLERWLRQLGIPDIVHWNNGLHDCGCNPDRSPRQIPADMYRMILGFVLERLSETGAQIIWATTTPVHPNKPFVENRWSWRNEDIDQYNEAALDLMRSHNIPVDDLHSVVMTDVDRNLAKDMIHLSEMGGRRCAEAVAAIVKKHLLQENHTVKNEARQL